ASPPYGRLFKSVRGEASGFFKRRYSFQLVGILLSIVLDIDRGRFTDRARHILWGERENEGHWIVGLSAVAKAKEPAGFGFSAYTHKLQFALSIRHWNCRSCLVGAERQSRAACSSIDHGGEKRRGGHGTTK